MRTTVIVLGSGQDGGVPQAGERRGNGPPRDASSIAVVSALGRVMLLDASPDFRSQTHRLISHGSYPADRDTCLDAIGITHAHMGHYGGLLHLGPEAMNTASLDLVATSAFHEYLTKNDPWAALVSGGHVNQIVVPPAYRLDDRTAVAAIPVPHRAEYTDTVAFSVTVDDDPWLLYLPDIDGWSAWPQATEIISAHAIALVDATFSSPDELPGRDISEVPHPFVSDTMARFAPLTSHTRIVLTHLNHSNHVGDPRHPDAIAAVTTGFEVAFDGMTFATE